MARAKTRVAVAPDFAEFDLNSLFRRNSKARVVAERLLSGEEMSRVELAKGLNLSVTTVPRVVKALEDVGFRISRDTDPHTRHARFRVVEYRGGDIIPGDRGGDVVAAYNATDLGASCNVLGIRVDQALDVVTVDFDIEGIGVYTGNVVKPKGEPTNVPATLIGGETYVRAWLLLSNGRMNCRIAGPHARDGQIEIRDLQTVTAPPPIESAPAPAPRRRR